MTIEIAAEDHALLQRLVDSGRFGTFSEAIHESLLPFAPPTEEWKRYAEESIAAGLADVEAGRTRPAEVVTAELKARYGV